MKAAGIITEEEAEAMDEMLVNSNIMPKAGKPGVLTCMGFLPKQPDYWAASRHSALYMCINSEEF
ncbi:MAG: hypothetical protein LBQ67_01585 [Treponema sp.]|nr:hypothetical protein [Treponema sp.]